MIRVNGASIEAEYVEYAVQFEVGEEWKDGDREVYLAVDMVDAYQVAALSPGSKVLARKVYETAWAEVSS